MGKKWTPEIKETVIEMRDDIITFAKREKQFKTADVRTHLKLAIDEKWLDLLMSVDLTTLMNIAIKHTESNLEYYNGQILRACKGNFLWVELHPPETEQPSLIDQIPLSTSAEHLAELVKIKNMQGKIIEQLILLNQNLTNLIGRAESPKDIVKKLKKSVTLLKDKLTDEKGN